MAVNLLFTIDVDNDGVENNQRTALSWTSVNRIPDIKALFDGLNLPLTWFVRADNQLKDVYGSVAYLLLEHEQLWSHMTGSGDEVTWHPHLYEWCAESREYVADRDEHRCAQKLVETRAELIAMGFNHSSVRIGEAWQSNVTMRTLDELGLEVDSSAIPGRKRNDESRVFDWETTPNQPYHPCVTDYRVPDADRALSILEVPMTTMPIKASYDQDFLPRYINPAFHHENFKDGLDRLFATLPLGAKGETFLTLILHADEIYGERTHPLYSFSLEVARKNVTYLLASLEAKKLEYRVLRMKDVRGVREKKWSQAQ